LASGSVIVDCSYSHANGWVNFVPKVDGGWSSFGTCSTTCGSGIQTRTCTQPAPSNGGAPCTGSSTQACNTDACPAGSTTSSGSSASSSTTAGNGSPTAATSTAASNPASSGTGTAGTQDLRSSAPSLAMSAFPLAMMMVLAAVTML